MRQTSKDKEFMEKLAKLIQSKDLWVEFKSGSPIRMVLKRTYGEKIHTDLSDDLAGGTLAVSAALLTRCMWNRF